MVFIFSSNVENYEIFSARQLKKVELRLFIEEIPHKKLQFNFNINKIGIVS